MQNPRTNPRVALLIDACDEDWSRLRYVLVLGEAELLASSQEHARALARPREKYPGYRAMPLEDTVVTKIRPCRLVLWRASLM